MVVKCLICKERTPVKGYFICWKCRKQKKIVPKMRQDHERKIAPHLQYDGRWDDITRAYEGD